MRCKKCGYEMVQDICGCIIPLCNPYSTQHDFDILAETYDRNIANEWKFGVHFEKKVSG